VIDSWASVIGRYGQPNAENYSGVT
jgi:hypothetical protein